MILVVIGRRKKVGAIAFEERPSWLRRRGAADQWSVEAYPERI
jgi:hypothetical protein